MSSDKPNTAAHAAAHQEGHGGAPSKTPNDELGFNLPPPRKVSKVGLVSLVVVVGVALGGAFAFGYLPKIRAKAKVEDTAKQGAADKRRVEVVSPVSLNSDRALVLPGGVQPLESTTIYPRTSGYIHNFLVDIGDKVKEGQQVAEIDTPDLDQQILQAEAQLAQANAQLVLAKANGEYARSTVERSRKLAKEGISSQQDLEQSEANARVSDANVTVANANIAAQQANIKRLTDLKAFSKVWAPFDGTITSRTIDRGALVTEGNGTPLFTIAATDTVRVFVNVPQDSASSVKAGIEAGVRVREFPGKVFPGKVSRTSGALDPLARTLTTEVRIPNQDNALLSGMYTEVSLNLPSSHRVFQIPSTALFNDAAGTRVALVDQDNKIHFAKVTIERDTGAAIEIASGISDTDRVVKLANAGLSDGTEVETIVPDAAPAGSAAPRAKKE